MIRPTFFEPDIAANFGAGLRLAACFGLDVEVIEPCGFPLDDRKLKRAAMDYGRLPAIIRHPSFADFHDATRLTESRVVLISRHATSFYDDFRFEAGDRLLVGRESAGVTNEVADAVDASISIPMAPATRSLNVITAMAIVAGEAMRQLGMIDKLKQRDQHER